MVNGSILLETAGSAMENHLELDAEIDGVMYTVELSYEAVYEESTMPFIDIEIHRVIAWDGMDDIEVSYMDLPTEIREQIEDIARYRAERTMDY